jgi:hypothetical protein
MPDTKYAAHPQGCELLVCEHQLWVAVSIEFGDDGFECLMLKLEATGLPGPDPSHIGLASRPLPTL